MAADAAIAVATAKAGRAVSSAIGGVAGKGVKALSNAGTEVAPGVAKGSTTGFRYMTEGELKAIQGTGMLRGGNPGKTYFTKDLYKSGVHAQQRLSLPTTPTLRVEFEILNNPTMRLNGSKVLPDFGMSGKGAEFMTTDPVKVRLINWQPLR
jgi:hypothetical protein